MKNEHINLPAACPLDAPVTNGCEAEHPRKAAPDFVVNKISRDEATTIVEAFHYSKMLPKGANVNFGAMDPLTGELLAATCYGSLILNAARPGTPRRDGWLELRRLVRRPGAVLTLSQFLAATLQLLKQRGVPAILSYADPEQDHHGGIYQATNWVNTKVVPPGNSFWRLPDGTELHARNVVARYGTTDRAKILAIHPDWVPFRPKAKIRYLMPLNLRKQKALAALQTTELPYPKPSPFLI